jgi:hypothetical protein
LFTAVYHSLFGLKEFAIDNIPIPRPPLGTDREIESARNGLDRVTEIFAADDTGKLTRDEQQFLQDSRRATTDEAVRTRRTKFLLGLIG